MKNIATKDAVDTFQQLVIRKKYFGKSFNSHITYEREGHVTQTGTAITYFNADTHSRKYGETSIDYFGNITKESGHYVLFNPAFSDFCFENGCLTVSGTGHQPGREGAYRVEIRPLW
ncbi:hypothetical protein [Azospirillum argentinense]